MGAAAAILAVIKAVPAFRDIFIQVVDLYNAAMDAAAEAQSIKVQREREATVAAMKQPGLSDEHRGVLRRRLWELHKL
jgi:hypothetical protein